MERPTFILRIKEQETRLTLQEHDDDDDDDDFAFLDAVAHNCEKRLLPSSCLSVCPFVCMERLAPTEEILIKFDI